MKNIETILRDFGLEIPEDKKQEFQTAFGENYKTIADYQKQKDKLSAAEQKVADTEAALKKFDGVDVEGFKKTIEDLEKKAKEADDRAEAQIRQRDQEDWLKNRFDKLGVKSERVRKALSADIMGTLTWKDGDFLGFDDYVKKENEKDKFYDTEDETKAKENAPKFTEPSQGEKTGGKKPFVVPAIW